MNKYFKTRRFALSAALFSMMLMGGLSVLLPLKQAVGQGAVVMDKALQQRVFQTPENAVKTLLNALRANNEKTLIEIFGAKYKAVIIPADRTAGRVNRLRLFNASQDMWTLRPQGDNMHVLVIGKQAWPLPIPLVRHAKGWRFDTAAGVDEIINRRIGRNELSAIEIVRAYVRAQKQYASKDHDGDKVREYAQKIKSTKGTQDGLYWPAVKGQELSPFGPLVAEQREYLADRVPGDPFKGYYFKILTRQGKTAPGGRHDYVINGNMIAGFAMVAFPADYGNSGVMTFLVSHNGTVYQKDLGPDSPSLGMAMYAFNPGKDWQPAID